MSGHPQTLSPLEVLRLYPAHGGTLNSLLASRASVDPQRPFLWFQGRTISYAQALQQVARTSAMLWARGVRAGDRIGVMSTNHPSTVFLLLGAARLGAVMVGVNPDYGVNEAQYVLDHAQVCGVLCSPQALPTARQACAQAGREPWFMVNEPGDGSCPLFDDELAGAPEADIEGGEDPDATCIFIYTSGTTGFPKGVMHSQRNVVMAGEGFVERMHLQPQDRLLCILPMFHVNAICYSFGGTLAAGATLVLEPRFSASRFWQVARDSQATEVNTIAAATGILMRRPRSEFVGGHRLKKMYGGPFSQEVYRVFQQEFHVAELIEGYGMSEIPGVLNNPYGGPYKIGSMGRPSRHPDPGIAFSQMRVVDEQGVPVPDGEAGELEVRTPILMQGYYRDPQQTAAAFHDGWFVTGDLGRRDAEGYFWFIARKKDIIRRRGENISGAELDAVVNMHPDVVNSAAVPVPSELGEDDILMLVVPRAGANITAQDIAAWCRERLAPYKVPRYVAMRSELPLTPTHRVAKYKLRAEPGLMDGAVDLQGG